MRQYLDNNYRLKFSFMGTIIAVTFCLMLPIRNALCQTGLNRCHQFLANHRNCEVQTPTEACAERLVQLAYSDEDTAQAFETCYPFIESHCNVEVFAASNVCSQNPIVAIYQAPNTKIAFENCYLYFYQNRTNISGPANISFYCSLRPIVEIFSDIAKTNAYSTCITFLSNHRTVERETAAQRCSYNDLLTTYSNPSKIRTFERCHRNPRSRRIARSRAISTSFVCSH